MNISMITATNTLSQLQKQMDTISHNIANVDTTGYKRREATFTDLLFQQVNNQRNVNTETNRLTPTGIRIGTGARLAQSQLILTQGTLKATGRSLDTAFTTEGQMYRVLVQKGGTSEIQYTRDGAFYLSPVSQNENMLVTKDGNPVLDENDNPIYINSQNVKEYTISKNGTLTAVLGNGATETFNLGVTVINNPQFLEQNGNNLFGLPANFEELNIAREDVFTDLNGGLRGQIGIQQNKLEQSNVDLTKEMTDLMSVQRTYQFQSKSVTLADQMMGLVNGIR